MGLLRRIGKIEFFPIHFDGRPPLDGMKGWDEKMNMDVHSL
jgi:hypothetical protein